MLQPFTTYLNLGKVKRKTPDPEEAKALLAKAEARLRYLAERKLSTATAVFILEDGYEAAREAAQSVMSKKGFKPYSHEATISFCRHFYQEEIGEDLLHSFDRFRQLRNDAFYKALPVTKEEANQCIQFAQRFIRKSSSLL